MVVKAVLRVCRMYFCRGFMKVDYIKNISFLYAFLGFFIFGNVAFSVFSQFLTHMVYVFDLPKLVRSIFSGFLCFYLIFSFFFVIYKAWLERCFSRILTILCALFFLLLCLVTLFLFGFYSPLNLFGWYMYRGLIEWRWDLNFFIHAKEYFLQIMEHYNG
jgi:hypothetical protein